MRSLHVAPKFSGPRRPLQILLVSDTHGAVDPRVRALVARCDAVVHAGDIGGAGVLRDLRPGSRAFYAVRGNNDEPAKWPADEREIVARLPDEIFLDLPGGRLMVVHGHWALPAARRHEALRTYYEQSNPRCIVYGHTHRMACDQSVAPWVLNPGAAGRARTFGGPSCLVLTIHARRWYVRSFRFSLATGNPSSPAKGLPSGAGKD